MMRATVIGAPATFPGLILPPDVRRRFPDANVRHSCTRLRGDRWATGR